MNISGWPGSCLLPGNAGKQLLCLECSISGKGNSKSHTGSKKASAPKQDMSLPLRGRWPDKSCVRVTPCVAGRSGAGLWPGPALCWFSEASVTQQTGPALLLEFVIWSCEHGGTDWEQTAAPAPWDLTSEQGTPCRSASTLHSSDASHGSLSGGAGLCGATAVAPWPEHWSLRFASLGIC